MATKLERFAYREFLRALNLLYVEAIAQIPNDQEASVNWIKQDLIQKAYINVWSTVSYVSAKATEVVIKNIADELTWQFRTASYISNNLSDRITEVWNTSKNQYLYSLNMATEQATNEGLGVEATTKRIQDLVKQNMGSINKWRARRIAQTELIGAGNWGAYESMSEAEGMGATIKKRWVCNPGASKTERHALIPGLHGQIRDINQPFDVDGEPLMYPGDPIGSGSNVINCKCTMVAIPEEEAQQLSTPALSDTTMEEAVQQQEYFKQVLTYDERDAISAYTGSQYRYINKHLRFGAQATDKDLWAIKELDKALPKGQDYKGTTYRGLDFRDNKDAFEDFVKDFKHGVVSDRGFMSSSISERTASAFSGSVYWAVIEVKGKTGKAIWRLSSHSGESEVLFMRGTKFRVLEYKIINETGLTAIIEEI